MVRWIGFALLTGLMMIAGPVMAEEQKPQPKPKAAPAQVPLSDQRAVTRGGRLYDNWALARDLALPKGTHPAYPAKGVLKGADTWRCPACHGWDYKGVSGINGEGSSHYTGIKGVYGLVNAPKERLQGYLRDKNHQYRTTMISDEAGRDLSAFMRKGQIDMEVHIDRTSRKVRGTPVDGADFYHSLCARCHGVDGRFVDAKNGGPTTVLGKAANINPWKALHKIRNGQPNGRRPSFVALLDQTDFNNILAFIQTLPEK